MKWIYFSMAVLLPVSFIACNHLNTAEKDATHVLAVQENKAVHAGPSAMQNEGLSDSVALPQNPAPGKQPANTTPAVLEDWDKKIIKTGNLTLEVKNYGAFNELLHGIVKRTGGYIAQEQQNQSDYKIENTVVIKVPAAEFGNAMQLLSPAGEKLTEKKISSEDVTAALVDTKARMEAKKKVRDRYLDFLKQAKNMNEVLQVQQEVNTIQETIEAASGRINYLGHAAAFSTINISYYQVLNAVPLPDPAPSYGLRVITSFKSGLQWFAELFIVLITLWPVWTGVILAWFFIKRIKLSPLKKP